MTNGSEQFKDEDQRLLERMAARDEAALGLLYDRYHVCIYTLALRVVGTRSEAEETVIEVFMQAWKNAGEYRAERGKVLNWLFTMARSRAIDLRRKSIRRDRVVQSIEDQPTLIQTAADSGEDAYQVEKRRQIRSALSILPETQRRAIELAYFEGMSHVEIAETLQEPLGTVKTRIRSGLATLRSELVSYM